MREEGRVEGVSRLRSRDLAIITIVRRLFFPGIPKSRLGHGLYLHENIAELSELLEAFKVKVFLQVKHGQLG